jgi:hypothetical protein
MSNLLVPPGGLVSDLFSCWFGCKLFARSPPFWSLIFLQVVFCMADWLLSACMAPRFFFRLCWVSSASGLAGCGQNVYTTFECCQIFLALWCSSLLACYYDVTFTFWFTCISQNTYDSSLFFNEWMPLKSAHILQQGLVILCLLTSVINFTWLGVLM